MLKSKILIIIGIILVIFVTACTSSLHIEKLDWENSKNAYTSDGL